MFINHFFFSKIVPFMR